MTDVCVITRPPATPGEFDDETGEYTPDPGLVIYGPTIEPHRGKCRLQIRSVGFSTTVAESETGGQTVIVQEADLQLPIAGTAGIAIGDVAKMTVVTEDPDLAGHELTVKARFDKSHAVMRRMRVEEVTG